MCAQRWGPTERGVISMRIKAKRRPKTENLQLNPQARLCAKFDETGIARFRVAPRGKMGLRVLDNCAEEHQM